MADKTGVLNRYNKLAKDLGKAALSSFYPNDVEYYLCAFELVSSEGTESYFVFPIQPSMIQKTELYRTNIKKSFSGVTVLRNSSFIPQELSLRGNFGKRFKILANLEGVSFSVTKIRDSKSVTLKQPQLSKNIKTGYGATKILQSILTESNKVDNLGKPKQLYFYNLGFGESYLVAIPPQGFMFTQSEDVNMIWQYIINLTIIANLGDVAGKDVPSSNRNILAKGVIQKGVNVVANDIKLMIT